MNEPEVAAAFHAFFIVFVMCLIVLSWALSVLIFCRLFHKAGYHWALGFLSIVPVINFFVPFFLAFARWPIEKELQQLKQSTARI
jgi:hypothetical protein